MLLYIFLLAFRRGTPSQRDLYYKVCDLYGGAVTSRTLTETGSFGQALETGFPELIDLRVNLTI